MRKTLFVLMFIASIGYVHAQDATSAANNYSQKLKTFFQVNGSEESYKTMIKGVIDMYKENYSSDPAAAAVLENMEKEMLKTSMSELVEMLVPVYEAHLTEKDLDTMIAFYQTEVGKKYAQATPAITEESVKIGQLWGMKVAKDVMSKLQNN